MITPAVLPAPRPSPAGNIDGPAIEWINSIRALLTSVHAPDPASVSSLFLPSSYWRDHLCLTWKYQTADSPASIAALLSSRNIVSITLSSVSNPIQVIPVDRGGKIPAITIFINVKTKTGHGVGVVRLLEDLDEVGKNWKAYTVYTALMGLDAYPERTGINRPLGTVHNSTTKRKNWKESRQEEVEFLNREPTVLIIGAGQCGLATAARLKMLGISALVIEKNKRVGDNWRNRYHQLGMLSAWVTACFVTDKVIQSCTIPFNMTTCLISRFHQTGQHLRPKTSLQIGSSFTLPL